MFEKIFEKLCLVAIITILTAIAWSMWRPVLLDQNRLQEIVKVLNSYGQSIRNINQDIGLLKQQMIKPEPFKPETK